MQLVISTVQRPNKSPYLNRLIKSIRREYKGDIHLVIGGKDTTYTDKYKKGFIKHFIGDKEKYPTNIQNAGFGYYTCLTLNRNEPLLVFEDDGLLKHGWYKDLKKRISFVPYDKYVLSLITPTPDTLIPEPNCKVPSVQRYMYAARMEYKVPGQLPISHIITYSNTTGMYYPVTMLKSSLPEYIFKFSVKGDAVYDIVLGTYMFRYDLPIYIAVPNLLIDTDVLDTNLGHIKPQASVDYSDWDYVNRP